jgi:DUF4097 and DUF4098 domain-containing protein YvlB
MGVSLSIASRSGRVRVTAEERVGIDVVGARSMSERDGTIVIEGGSNAITVRCPPDSDLRVGTSSGRVECSGRFGEVHVTTASARVDIEECAAADVRTRSGRVEVGNCTGSLRCITGNAAIHVGHAGSADLATGSGAISVGEVGSVRAHASSGRIELGTARGAEVDVRAHSGSVTVTLPAGSRPQTSVLTRSGRVRCDCERGDEGRISVETTSGSITVACAP